MMKRTLLAAIPFLLMEKAFLDDDLSVATPKIRYGGFGGNQFPGKSSGKLKRRSNRITMKKRLRKKHARNA